MAEDVGRRTLIAGGLALGAVPALPALGGTAAAETSAQTGAQTGALIGPARRDRLHVMSFNVRVPVDAPPRSWAERRPMIKRLLKRESPTLLGTQEGVFAQLQDILEDLGPAYDWIHLFREGGSAGEAMAVLYDRRRLKPVAYDHLWLSDTPRLIGSRSWGNNVVRMLTWVRFQDRRTGKTFVHLNTHFDHQSEPSRQRSAEMVRDTLAALSAQFGAGRDVGVVPDPCHSRRSGRHVGGGRGASHAGVQDVQRLESRACRERRTDRLGARGPGRRGRAGGDQHLDAGRGPAFGPLAGASADPPTLTGPAGERAVGRDPDRHQAPRPADGEPWCSTQVRPTTGLRRATHASTPHPATPRTERLREQGHSPPVRATTIGGQLDQAPETVGVDVIRIDLQQVRARAVHHAHRSLPNPCDIRVQGMSYAQWRILPHTRSMSVPTGTKRPASSAFQHRPALAACNFGSDMGTYRLNGTTGAVSLLPSNTMTVQAVNLNQARYDGVRWTMTADYSPTRLNTALLRGGTCPNTVHICVHANSYTRSALRLGVLPRRIERWTRPEPDSFLPGSPVQHPAQWPESRPVAGRWR